MRFVYILFSATVGFYSASTQKGNLNALNP